jgi:hypothetical protein
MALAASSDFLTAFFYYKAMTQTTSHKYFIGDLCYVLSDEWSDVCDVTLAPTVDPEEDFFFELEDGRSFHMISTAYGDGVYYDQKGNSYPVDSGTIGAIKVENLDPAVLADALERGLGAVHEFPYELLELDAELERGILHFGDVSIDTAGFEDEDEEDPEEEDEYDDEEEEGEEA